MDGSRLLEERQLLGRPLVTTMSASFAKANRVRRSSKFDYSKPPERSP